MFTIEVDDRIIGARLAIMSAAVRASLKRAISRSAVDLQKYIIREKLSESGTYRTNPSLTTLHKVSGDLARSIQQQVSEDSTSVTAKVYSAGDVKYAAIHEFGGTIQRFGKKVGAYTVNMPKRSFMRSSLDENRDLIIDSMTQAVKQGLAAT